MDKLELHKVPFNEYEMSFEYVLTSFYERGVKINLLSKKEDKENTKRLPSGSLYSVGVIENGQYYWYFYGGIAAKTRDAMISLFLTMLKLTNMDTSQTLFVFKHNKLTK